MSDDKRERGLYLRDKTWWMRLTCNGQLIQQSCHTSNKKEARAYLAAVRTKINEGRFIPEKKHEQRITLKEFATFYINTYSVKNKKVWRGDGTRLCHLWSFFGENMPIANIARGQVAEFRAARSNGEVIPT